MPAILNLPSPHSRTARKHTLMYFICGNPGVISFYEHFFDCLRGLLDSVESSSATGTAYHLYGRSLLGFEDDEHPPFTAENQPWDVEGQVQGVYEHVASLRTDKGERYDAVVLMGHSVGTFIAVEVFHRHLRDPGRAPGLRLERGFLLFPTVTHIAKSPSGRMVTLLQRLPFFTLYAQQIAALLLSLLSSSFLAWYFTRIGGFTPATARTCARWLKSRDGVRQSIHMGLDEMRVIGEEKWEEELWEATEEGGARFYMFYGREDHWVAGEMRDAFIGRRRVGGGTRIVVDEGDIGHAFSVKEDDSWAVARRVASWVDEMEQSAVREK
ncbi:hypothetical protein S40288_01563 [Stachybotrys chartarum IBT 40288]|nr:hypothetical protein S40288_01563 [Stachybotrys chartarum IBT 40288]